MNKNMEMMKQLVKEIGVDGVEALVKRAEARIKKEEESYKKIISQSHWKSKYITFPEWTEDVVDHVTTELGTKVVAYGSGNMKNLSVTCRQFAKYIVYTCNDDGETLKNVLEILLSAPAWCKGYGMTRARMELVFHILVLHKVNGVVDEMKRFLNEYDPTSLKVYAHDDEAFRHVLSNEVQMIAYTERYICNAIGNEEVKFNFVA